MAICVDIVPTPCGGTNKLTMKDVCNDVHFTGIEDTTINQGVGIDLTEGIHAYDGNGNEIEYTVTPDSIDKCDVGEHTVVYRTIGEGDKFLPSFCMDNVDVTLGDTFCNEILLEEDRIVTITQADPPTIEGIETIPTIYPNEEFDPTEGITATDDNGKTIDFTYSGRVEDSSEGAIASFETEFEQDALSVVADIEPIQSLNGYDKPWSGGNGKNKLPSRNGTVTNGGLTFSCNGDNIWHISGTSTTVYPQWLTENGTLSFPVGTTLTLSKTVNNAPSGAFVYGILYERDTPTGSNIVSRSIRNVGSLTFTIEHPYQAFVVVAEGNGITYTNTSIALQIELGSTATSFAPYTNICPISGHDEVNVWNDPKYGGTIEWNQLAPNNYSRSKDSLVPFSSGTTFVAGRKYFLSRKLSASESVVNAVFCRADGVNRNSFYIDGTKTATIKQALFSGTSIGNTTTTEGNAWIYQGNNSNVVTVTDFNIIDLTQMFGSTIADYIYSLETANAGAGVAWFKNLFPKDFYAYNSGETTCVSAVNGDPYKHYTTDLGRTVYGGTLDVVSGVLTVDRAMVDLGTLDWRYASAQNVFYVNGFNAATFGAANNYNYICERYVSVRTNADLLNTNGSVYMFNTAFNVHDENYTDVASFKSAISGTMFCYELATPQTIQLTPQEVELLLGQNNVWADTGDIKVIYEKEMPASGNIEYLTAGSKIITYTATDECGNQTVEQRIVYVLGDTPQVCMAEVCTAHVACEDNQ